MAPCRCWASAPAGQRCRIRTQQSGNCRSPAGNSPSLASGNGGGMPMDLTTTFLSVDQDMALNGGLSIHVMLTPGASLPPFLPRRYRGEKNHTTPTPHDAAFRAMMEPLRLQGIFWKLRCRRHSYSGRYEHPEAGAGHVCGSGFASDASDVLWSMKTTDGRDGYIYR